MTPREALNHLSDLAWNAVEEHCNGFEDYWKAVEVLERIVKIEEDEVLVDED